MVSEVSGLNPAFLCCEELLCGLNKMRALMVWFLKKKK